ncbi:MAG: hypothetical protein ACOVP4_08965 [Bacteriovoracaceae bacterium]
MRSLFFRGIIVFCVLMVATTMMMDVFKTSFGTVDYFQKHGLFFLVFITFFPRLTLLFSSVASGGFLWWAAWVFCPRILVATLATVSYFHTNPLLVVMSWLIALGGEAFEKWGLGRKKNTFVFRTYRAAPENYSTQTQERKVDDGNVIEAEFTKKD